MRNLVAALVFGACALPLVGCAHGAKQTAVVDALFDERLTLPLADLGERVALAPDENFRVALLGRDAHSSHHAVAIRDREQPHRHDRHDLVVVIVRGHGQMRLGDEERAVGTGSVLYIPRATVHAFRNESPEPAVAYAVYTPAFDGNDRILVGE